ncbi:MAG: ATP synthase F0 subunit B, partial [Desulfosalsimonas sp.]
MIPEKSKVFSAPAVILLLAGVFFIMLSGAASAAEETHWVATDTYRVINFVVLAAIIIFLLRKPVKQFFGDRTRLIREQLEDLESQKQAAEKKLEEYNDRLAALSRESEKIIEDYRRQGENLKAQILKEAEAAANKLEEQATKNIEREFARAKLQLETEVFDKAVEKAE